MRPLDGIPETNRGNSEVIVPNDEPRLVVDLHAEASQKYGEILSVVIVTDNGGCDPCTFPEDVIVLLRGILTFALGCVTFKAVIDIINGVIISIPAETVYVQAQMLVLPKIGTDPNVCHNVPPVTVSAGIAYYNLARSTARLTEVAQVPVGGRKRIPIPAFAVSFTVLPSGAGLAETEIITFGPGFSPKHLSQGPLTNLGQFNIVESVPLPNGAKCIEVANLSVVDPLIADIVFQLSL